MPGFSLGVLILPIAFFMLLLFFLWYMKHTGKVELWHPTALITMVVFSAILVLVTEFLGVISRINASWLSLTWGILVLALTYFGWRCGWLSAGWRMLREILSRLKLLDWILLLCVASILVLLFAVGIAAPANNVDVMQYHMPRVLQWTQNESLAHFPTAYDNQNTRPYFTELMVLNMSVLSGSDWLVNTVQLFGAVGTMIAVAGIVSLLGGGRRAQWVAALFTFSLPMGLLQLTTPKNDVMVGFWIAALLFFVVRSKKDDLAPVEFLAFGLSLGLGMLTKGTFLPFAFPIMVWYFLPKIRTHLLPTLAKECILLLLLVIGINGAFWLRNIQTYGGPYGEQLPINIPFSLGMKTASVVISGGDEKQGKQSRDYLAITEAHNGAQTSMYEPRVIKADWVRLQILPLPVDLQSSIVSIQWHKIARMAAMNLMTPISSINNLILKVLGWFPAVYPESFRGMLRESVWNYANTAANPLHFLLTALSLIFAMVKIRRGKGGIPAQISLVALAGYGLTSFGGCVEWTVCMRYQLPFFIFGGVLLGIFVPTLDKKIGILIAALFLVYSLPYVLLNNMRPVIGMKPWPTRIDSVLVTPQDEILFAHFPNFRDEYAWVAEQISESQCSQVGLYLKAYEFEYPFWWLLGAPRSDIELQHIHSTPATERYQDPSFVPCAVICTVCGGEQKVAGLPLVSDLGSVQYYSSFQPNPEVD